MDNEHDFFERHLRDLEDETEVVELRPCYEYTCECCGRDSHIPITVQETHEGAFLLAKARFSCAHCDTALKGVPWMFPVA